MTARDVLRFVVVRREVDLVLTPKEAVPIRFVSQLFVRDLSLAQVDVYGERTGTLVRKISTIISGHLYQESLNGQELTLHSGESIRFGSSDGQIRSLELEENRMSLRFYGLVEDMKTGWGRTERSLMPTYLQWLKAQRGLYLFWGTALYLFGLIVTVLNWWGARI